LPTTNRLIDLSGVKISNFESIEHGQVFAVPVDISGGLHNGLIVAFHVGKRRGQSLLQPGNSGLPLRKRLGQNKRGRPVALLEKCIKQQFLGQEVVRLGNVDRAQLDDRFIISAGPQQRADGFMLRRGLRIRTAGNV